MKNLWRKDNIIIPIGGREILLYNILHITKADKTFYILGNEHFGTHYINYLFHPHIQLAACFLRGFVVNTFLSIVGYGRIETFSFSCNTEILTRETTRHDIYVMRKNVIALLL